METYKREGYDDLVGAFVGIMVVIIIALGAVIPVVQQIINNTTLTGTSLTLLNLVPLLLVVAVIMSVVGLILYRRMAA